MNRPDILFSKNKRSYTIKFSEFFGLDTDEYDLVNLSKKRSYIDKEKNALIIINAIRVALDENIDASVKYFNIVYNSKKEDYTDEDLVKDITELCSLVLENINNYIDSVYVPLKKTTKKIKSVELQFTDVHSKMLLKTSYLMKVVLPLITNFLYQKNLKNYFELYMDCFNPCFELTQKDGVNLTNKIYKLINSRISMTCYSDKTIWSYLTNMSIDPTILCSNFYREILVDIIPKLEGNRSVISFIHVALKYKLRWLFDTNFNLTYLPMNLNEVDSTSDKLTNLEKLEFHLARNNESDMYVNNAKVGFLLRNILYNPMIKISPEEIKYYKEHIQINSIQMNFVFLYFSKRIGRYQNFFSSLTFGEYVVLLIHLSKWLAKNGFSFLPNWLFAQFPEGLSSGRTISTKQFTSELLDSKSFKNLHNKKYSNIIHNITKINLIPKIISTVYTNKAIYVPTFEESKETEKVNNNLLNEFNLKCITGEVLKFIEII